MDETPNRLEAGAAADSGFTLYVDANPLADRHLTGIGRYTARVVLSLARLVPLRFFSNGKELILNGELDPNLDQDLGSLGRWIWSSRREPLGTPPARSAGLFGCLRPVEKLFPVEMSILHDFTPLVVPWTHSEKTRGMFRGFFAKSLLSSDCALAVSHATKADAGWLTPFPQHRIVVAHSGPSLCVESHCDDSTPERRPNVGLVVSTLEPRKNPFFLLDWFRDSDALPDGAELWWVGPLGWLTSRKALEKYRRLPRGRRVRFLGVVPDRELCRLYRTVGWSIYPSLYEGFGFPVLDSLRHGTPVLASYNSALREFDTPGIHFFDPSEPSTVDQAWQKLRRASPIAIPQEPLDAHYRWDRVARTIVETLTGFLERSESSSSGDSRQLRIDSGTLVRGQSILIDTPDRIGSVRS
ncbi:glycosyltransferase [Tautonia rosea]|uniref:glycosyltransferase n=1 Tax=Tautonia rosea TaxID=2728037 RepID=UPI0014740C87|nr:glycosyltransferase [Tautonia rosea]